MIDKVITDTFTLEKMAEDMYIYPQKFGWFNEYDFLLFIRKEMPITWGYSGSVNTFDSEEIVKYIDGIIDIVPERRLTGLGYFVINPEYKITPEEYYKTIIITQELLANKITAGDWYQIAIIEDKNQSLKKIKFNLLFSLYNDDEEVSNITKNKEIHFKIAAYRMRLIQNLYPGYKLPLIKAILKDSVPEYSTSFKKLNILFVGNDILCCIAQGILTEMFYRYFAKDVNVESAVFSELSDSENSEKFIQIGKESGYMIDNDPPIIIEKMLHWADHIFVMSSIQFKSLRLRLPQDQWPKFHIFMSYCFNSIEEPLAIYCKTNEEYQQLFDKIEYGCRKILLSLRNFV